MTLLAATAGQGPKPRGMIEEDEFSSPRAAAGPLTAVERRLVERRLPVDARVPASEGAPLTAAQTNRCENILDAIARYKASGNLRDMADEIRRGEIGFVSKRLAESCGVDQNMLPLLQRLAGRRAVVGTGLALGWLAQRKVLRAVDAVFGVTIFVCFFVLNHLI